MDKKDLHLIRIYGGINGDIDLGLHVFPEMTQEEANKKAKSIACKHSKQAFEEAGLLVPNSILDNIINDDNNDILTIEEINETLRKGFNFTEN